MSNGNGIAPTREYSFRQQLLNLESTYPSAEVTDAEHQLTGIEKMSLAKRKRFGNCEVRAAHQVNGSQLPNLSRGAFKKDSNSSTVRSAVLQRAMKSTF
jgi:hypothetical protein